MFVLLFALCQEKKLIVHASSLFFYWQSPRMKEQKHHGGNIKKLYLFVPSSLFSFLLHSWMEDCENCSNFASIKKHNKNFTNGCINIKAETKRESINWAWKGCSITDICRTAVGVGIDASCTIYATSEPASTSRKQIESSARTVHSSKW